MLWSCSSYEPPPIHSGSLARTRKEYYVLITHYVRCTRSYCDLVELPCLPYYPATLLPCPTTLPCCPA